MRETQNIIYYLLDKNYTHAWLLIKRFDSLTRKDTWNGFKEITWCKLIGHKPDYSNIGYIDQEQDIWCKCCKKYLTTLSYEEHMKLIRKEKLKRVIK